MDGLMTLKENSLRKLHASFVHIVCTVFNFYVSSIPAMRELLAADVF